MSIIGWIIVGAIAGWIAEKVMGRDDGLLMNIVIGIVGAFIGGFIATRVFDMAASGGWIYSILVAVVGALVLLFVVGLVRGRSVRR